MITFTVITSTAFAVIIFLNHFFKIPMELATLRDAPPQRERPQSQGPGLLPQGQLQRDVQNPGELPILRAKPPQAPDPLDEGPLHRGRETSRSTSGCCRQIPDPTKVPTPSNYLGRRRDIVLLQGEVSSGTMAIRE